MPPNTRALLYNALKDAGWEPQKGFTAYTLAELQGIKAELIGNGTEVREPVPAPEPPRANAPDPAELPGQRQNTGDDPIRIDDQGRQWYQEEVRKPAYPKPRGRRVLTYQDPGSTQETVRNGEYTETFEVAGDRKNRPSEVKITLPSYQVGIYKDPRFPFKIHCYDGREGFDLFDVQNYYGGAQLVPMSVRRVYIENDLCYDMRSVINTIQAEYRQLILQKGAR
jgi:hypothetical protein